MTGTISNLISKMNKNEEQFNEKVEAINSFMREYSLPQDLKDRILGYYDFMWARHKSFKLGESIINEIPEVLASKIAKHIHHRY